MNQPSRKISALLMLAAMAAAFPAAAEVSALTGSPALGLATKKPGVVVWFNSVLRPTGFPLDRPVTICVTQQVITYQDGANTETVEVPDAMISFKPWETRASTRAAGEKWNTSVPTSNSLRDTFMSGVAHPAPFGLPHTATSMTWTGRFESDVEGVTVEWQWGAAPYTHLTDNYDAMQVAPVDRRKAELAGTPTAFKRYFAGSGRGSDFARFAGKRSGIAEVMAEVTGRCGGIY